MRNYCVHPVNSSRLLQGTFCVLFNQLREYECKFFNYFRMSFSSYDELYHTLENILQKEDTNMRLAIPPMEILALSISVGTNESKNDLSSSATEGAGTGGESRIDINLISSPVFLVKFRIWPLVVDYFVDVHYTYRIEKSTASLRVRTVRFAIWTCLSGQCSPQATEDTWKEMANGFQIRTNIPYCLGDLDGKNDTIIKNSPLWRRLNENNLNIQTSLLLIKRFSTIAYYGPLRFVECIFGILSNKWHVFHGALNVKVNFAVDITKACCVLHNFVRVRDSHKIDDILTVNSSESHFWTNGEDLQLGTRRTPAAATRVDDAIRLMANSSSNTCRAAMGA
ncbi:hypothetical protein PR048_022394 [Dryococelus australis]|uniref:DDE Tnp4 domain-containing protein n=1 Tax=Dryococelus australis TaxID=614101 RepID=A0ABQ9H0V7_9NEOP|nr:hypothetical protein PR048_022394 [Dryococelus australis]